MSTRKKISGEPSFLNRRIKLSQKRYTGKNRESRKKAEKSNTVNRNILSINRIYNKLKKKAQRLKHRNGSKQSLERRHLSKAYRTVKLNNKGGFRQKMRSILS